VDFGDSTEIIAAINENKDSQNCVTLTGYHISQTQPFSPLVPF
jgi:hypothetical protein